MKRLLPKTILLALATSLTVVSAASAYPVIDPPDAPPGLVSPNTRQLTDGWYSAAIQQTILNAAKKHPRVYYRSSLPISGHGPMLP